MEGVDPQPPQAIHRLDEKARDLAAEPYLRRAPVAEVGGLDVRSTERSFPRITLGTALCMVVLALGLAACTSGPPAPQSTDYVTQVMNGRSEKDRLWREEPDSPVPVEKRARVLPLKYYPVDLSYSTPAALQLSNDRPVFDMPTSTGTKRKMQRVGVLGFTLHGKPHTLEAFVEDGTVQITSLFVPFADKTTGTETYAAGRYLDLKPTSTGYYTIDFDTTGCNYTDLATKAKAAAKRTGIVIHGVIDSVHWRDTLSSSDADVRATVGAVAPPHRHSRCQYDEATLVGSGPVRHGRRC